MLRLSITTLLFAHFDGVFCMKVQKCPQNTQIVCPESRHTRDEEARNQGGSDGFHITDFKVPIAD